MPIEGLVPDQWSPTFVFAIHHQHEWRTTSLIGMKLNLCISSTPLGLSKQTSASIADSPLSPIQQLGARFSHL
jgi:hypothetical protein